MYNIGRSTMVLLPILTALLNSQVYADVTYSVVNIGGLSGGTESYARSINNHGQVVGDTWSVTGRTAFYYSSVSGYTTISSNVSKSRGSAINDSGQIVGLEGNLGFYIDQGVKRTIYAQAGTGATDTVSSLSKINSSGYVVGNSMTHVGNYSSSRAGLLSPSGQWTPFLVDGTNSAKSINDQLTVVGNVNLGGNQMRAAKWTPDSYGSYGAATILGSPTSDYSDTTDINNNDYVTGYFHSTGDNYFHASIWKSDNTTIDLGVANRQSPFSSIANAINEHNVVVGQSSAWSYNYHAAMWLPDADGNYTMVDLNTLIDPNSGWVLNVAYDINDSGEIVGFGSYNGNEEQAFLLTVNTIPEPLTGGIFGCAAFFSLLLRYKK